MHRIEYWMPFAHYCHRCHVSSMRQGIHTLTQSAYIIDAISDTFAVIAAACRRSRIHTSRPGHDAFSSSPLPNLESAPNTRRINSILETYDTMLDATLRFSLFLFHRRCFAPANDADAAWSVAAASVSVAAYHRLRHNIHLFRLYHTDAISNTHKVFHTIICAVFCRHGISTRLYTRAHDGDAASCVAHMNAGAPIIHYRAAIRRLII